MRHWTDPIARGVYQIRSAIPPAPSHHAANDLASRLARVEEHLQWSHHNQARIEDESRLRARDLGEGMDAMTERQDEMDDRLRVLEQDKHTRKRLWGLATTFGMSAGAFVRYLIAGLLVLLVAAGKADIQTLKQIMGFASGTPLQ